MICPGTKIKYAITSSGPIMFIMFDPKTFFVVERTLVAFHTTLSIAAGREFIAVSAPNRC